MVEEVTWLAGIWLGVGLMFFVKSNKKILKILCFQNFTKQFEVEYCESDLVLKGQRP